PRKTPGPFFVLPFTLPYKYPGHIRPQPFQPRDNRILGGILGTQNQRAGRLGPQRTVRKRPAGAEPRAPVQRQQRLAQVRITVEEDKLAQWDSSGPKP